jgi:hypothetical protein
MTMPDFRISSSTSGPIFDGRAARAASQYADHARREIADEGYRMVHQRLRQVLRNPTGYYQSRIAVRQVGSAYEVHDSRVIYGPWLEGTGSRNFPETRFRGYATFRRTKALLDRRAPGIAQRILPRYTRRM